VPPPESAPGSTPGSAIGRALAPLRLSAYRRLAVALVLSTFASGVWAVAIVWEVIRIGGGPGQLSVVAASGTLGVIIPALLGGVVADRVRQKSILLADALLQALGMALAAVIALGEHSTVAELAVVSFVLGVGMAFYYPAYSAWLPALVPAEQLQAVNGFEGMVRPGVHQAIGPAVAGAAVAAINPAAAMAIAATSSLAAFVALLTVPRTDVRRDLGADEGGARPALLRDLREGVAYLRTTPWLGATLAFAALVTLVMLGPMEVLIPFLITDELGGGPRDHSYVLAAFGIGGALGSLVMAGLRMPRRYLTLMVLGWGLAGLPFLVIGTADRVWPVIASGLVIGALFSAPQVIWGTLLQRRVPPHMLGRVSSLDFFVSISLMPASMALAGPVAHAIGLRETFLLAAGAPIVFAVVVVLAGRLHKDELAHPLDQPDQTAGVSDDSHVTRR
jgi:MFS family permease